MTYTHDDLLGAIDMARVDPTEWGSTWWNANLDTLRAILDLHDPDPEWVHCWCDGTIPWPCPTVQIVADALRKMGAL